MRLCIIPDIHNRVDLTKSLIDKEHNNVDKFVMLGDLNVQLIFLKKF